MDAKFLLAIILLFYTMNFYAQTHHTEYKSFTDYPVYEAYDLGLTYTSEGSTFKVYSPAVSRMNLYIYADGHTDSQLEKHAMTLAEKGVWEITLPGDYQGKYYNFQVRVGGRTLKRVPDPYAKAVGLNGERAMILDLQTTDPKGWEKDERPPLQGFNDIVIYEVHVRDLSAHPESGIKNKRKFLGLGETGTKNKEGLATGLDHLKELGVTHVHLLPSFDFMKRSVDEANPTEKYNWGYDPQNYNVPDGSYATDPYDGAVRVREFKEMVQALHANGIRVIMDVVYNHTGMTQQSIFNQIAPGYYYRFWEDGKFADASACGNETASERPMVRKFIWESMLHWCREYHIDGFRIDLMGIHDIATINTTTWVLQKEIDKSIFVYGEGWMGGDSPLPYEDRALKVHAPKLEEAAVFSDDIRDALKGGVFNAEEKGFVSGGHGLESTIRLGVVGGTQHSQIDYGAVNYSKAPFANRPTQCINYASCHDNHTLYDRLVNSTEGNEKIIGKMHRLANAIVLTSQGVPFLHAGSEIMRSKDGVENSYRSPEKINQIDWSTKQKHLAHFNYYKGLIALRKAHPAFRMPTTEMVQKHLEFVDGTPTSVVAFQLKDHANGDDWEKILVIYNANSEEASVELPKGKWRKEVWEMDFGISEGAVFEGKVEVPEIGMVVLIGME